MAGCGYTPVVVINGMTFHDVSNETWAGKVMSYDECWVYAFFKRRGYIIVY